MYKIIENTKRMTKEEMKKEFANKWVFVVDADFAINMPMSSGIPIVVADSAWEGRDEGIYQNLKDKYEKTTYLSFLTNEKNVFGFSEVLPVE